MVQLFDRRALALALIALVLSLVGGPAPGVAEPRAKPAVIAESAVNRHELREVLSASEIANLASAYEKVWSNLKDAFRVVDQLRGGERGQAAVMWGEILAENDRSLRGKALNEIVAFQMNYDGSGALMQLSNLTGDPKWRDRARQVAAIYSAAVVLPSQGKVQAFRNYSSGPIAVGKSFSDQEIVRAMALQTKNAPYIALNEVTRNELKSPFLSREAALATIAIANAALLSGTLERELFRYHVECVTGHLAAWERALKAPGTEVPGWPMTVSGEYQGLSPLELRQVQQSYVRPFMVALSVRAVLAAHDVDPEGSRPALVQAAKTLYAMHRLWSEKERSFPYTDRSFPADHKLTKLSEGLTTEPAPDLNGIIGAAYLRLGNVLNDTNLKEFGRIAFRAGLSEMYTGPKQLNQALNLFNDRLLRQ